MCLTGDGGGSHLRCEVNHGGSPAKAVGLSLGTYLEGVGLVGTLVPRDSPLDSLIKRHLGAIPKQLLSLVHVGARIGHVTGLVGQLLHIGLLANVLLDNRDELVQTRAVSLAKVEHLVGMRTVDGTYDAINDVIDVGVIPRRRAIAELLKLNSTADAVDELEGSHIGSASGSAQKARVKENV